MNIKINAGRLRSELRRADKRPLAAGAAVMAAVGCLSFALIYMLGGSTLVYHQIALPVWAPPKFLFVFMWTLMSALIGAATGAVICSRDGFREVDKYRGLLMFVMMSIFGFIWYPLFFVACAFFLSFMDLLVMGALVLYTMSFYRKIYFFSAAALGVYFIWLCYVLLMNFSILLAN